MAAAARRPAADDVSVAFEDIDDGFASADGPPPALGNVRTHVTTDEVACEPERIEEIAQECEDGAEGDEEAAVADGGSGGGEGDDDIKVALQKACVSLGYDRDNIQRKKLVSELAGCDGERAFPADILKFVCEETGKGADVVTPVMRSQVSGVISSFGVAIFQAESEQYKKDAPFREKLRTSGLCPAGFDWHRTATGWCCNGGAHQITGHPP